LSGTWAISNNEISSPGYTYGIYAAVPSVITGNNVTIGANAIGVYINGDQISAIGNLTKGTISNNNSGIRYNGAQRRNNIVRNNHISGVFYGIYAGAAAYTNSINSGNTFASVNVPFNGNTSASGFLVDDDGSGTLISTNVPLLLAAYPVSSLPVCNMSMRGGFALVTDAINPGYLTPVAGGGGTTEVRVLCNGSAWIYD
jgi:hypothetical protein